MLITTPPLYSLNDVTIIPAKITEISSRGECNITYDNGKLPLFTAPMSCVIDENNWKLFDNKVNVIIPRNISLETRLEMAKDVFAAVSLSELEFLISNKDCFKSKRHILVDIANGHMKKLYETCEKAKYMFDDNITIMVGNIANPETYRYICDLYYDVIDYVRCSIGSGKVCTTSSNTAVHYPMASLITEIYKISFSYRDDGRKTPYIIADGGFTNFDQIIKALALGADYVMLGSIFAKTEESCGKEVLIDGKRMKEYYGMSTRKAQKEFGSERTKTAEGISSMVNVEYSLDQWLDNFESYLKSAMSYTNFRDIKDFVGGPTLYPMTNSSYKTYFK